MKMSIDEFSPKNTRNLLDAILKQLSTNYYKREVLLEIHLEINHCIYHLN